MNESIEKQPEEPESLRRLREELEDYIASSERWRKQGEKHLRELNPQRQRQIDAADRLNNPKWPTEIEIDDQKT